MGNAISGIYRIRNVVNGHSYIGSSNNVGKRWRSHVGYLKRGKHQSIKLQRAWDKHGQDAFLLEVLEEVSDEGKLLEREQHYLDIAKPVYNMTQTVNTTFQGRKHSPETIAKMREAANKRNQNPEYIAKLKAPNAGWKNIQGGDWLARLPEQEREERLAVIRSRPGPNAGRKFSPESSEKKRVANIIRFHGSLEAYQAKLDSGLVKPPRKRTRPTKT